MKRFQHSIKKETIVILSIRDEMPENDARTELENKIEQLVKVAKEADKEQIKVMTNSLQISVGMAKSQEQDPMEIEKLTGLAETLKDIEEKNSSGKFVRLLVSKELKETPVTIGLRGDDGLVEILSGVKAGDQVVTYVKPWK